MRILILAPTIVCFLLTVAMNNVQAQTSGTRLPPALQRIADAIVKSDATSENELKEQLFRSLIGEVVRTNQVDVVRALIKKGANLKFGNVEGDTLLHIAAGEGHIELLSILIDHGIDVDQLNRSKRSALFEAANGNHLASVKQLLKHGADVNGNSKHNSPLNTAAWYGHSEIVKTLLVAKADLKRTDVDGNTASHKAIWQGRYACVKLLLDAGADLNVKNSAGITPMSLAGESSKKTSSAGFRNWGPEQMIGPPANNPTGPQNWCPSTINSKERVTLFFDAAIETSEIEFHINPSSDVILSVVGYGDDGKAIALSKDRKFKRKKNTVFGLAVSDKTKIRSLKLELDCGKTPNWVYVDAIALVDSAGKKHWVDWAETTTTYAQGQIPKLIRQRKMLQMIKKHASK